MIPRAQNSQGTSGVMKRALSQSDAVPQVVGGCHISENHVAPIEIQMTEVQEILGIMSETQPHIEMEPQIPAQSCISANQVWLWTLIDTVKLIIPSYNVESVSVIMVELCFKLMLMCLYACYQSFLLQILRIGNYPSA